MLSEREMTTLTARADAVRWSRHRRAVEAYCEAFGGTYQPGSSLCCCTIHNALLAFEEGKPWREVNYSALRRADRLLESMFEAQEIVRRLYARKWNESRH